MDNDRTPEPAAIWLPTTALTPWMDNPRHNDEAVPEVAHSIERFGFAAPIIARAVGDGFEVIAGHTRLKAAQNLGLDRVPVRVMDLDPADAKLLALADNRVGEIADWSDGLGDLLRQMDADGLDITGLGWSDVELTELLTPPGFDTEHGDDAPDLDDGPADSQPGEVYALGPHKVACGDSTDPQIWTALLGDERLQAVWTDPPYGVEYVGGNHSYSPEVRLKMGGKTIANDNLSDEDLRALLTASLGQAVTHCEPGAAWYVTSPPGSTFHEFGTVLKGLDVWRHTLVWAKDRMVLGRSDYHYRHEAIFYGWTPGGSHYFTDDRTKTSIIDCPRPHASKEHPTMKPIALITDLLSNSTKPGWLVGDPFAGSGSTLIACATMGLAARCIELDPHYCDVIRRRWTRLAVEHEHDPGPGALS